MADQGASTVIAEDVRPGESLQLIDRSRIPNRAFEVDVFDTFDQPVTMVEKTVADDQPDAAAAAVQVSVPE